MSYYAFAKSYYGVTEQLDTTPLNAADVTASGNAHTRCTVMARIMDAKLAMLVPAAATHSVSGFVVVRRDRIYLHLSITS